MKRRASLAVFTFASICLFFSFQSFAQQVSATLLGTVRDRTGAVMPRAEITIDNVNRGWVRVVTTGPTGRYEAADLPLGSYSVTASKSGFKKSVVAGITLQSGEHRVQDFTLEVGSVTTTVQVPGNAVQLMTLTSAQRDPYHTTSPGVARGLEGRDGAHTSYSWRSSGCR